MPKQKNGPSGRGRLLAAALAGALGLLLLASAQLRREVPGAAHGNGLFSWHAEVLEAGRREEVFSLMGELGLTELYQHVPRDTESEAVQSFAAAADRAGIAVYLLAGDPSWGLDGSGGAMVEAVDRAAAYGDLRGVMLDVEPYAAEEWDADPEGVMARYVSAMAAAWAAADEAGLELIACIPYFYDSLGLEDALAPLVEQGCHALAVMNYDKADEAANLETEAALAAACGKPLVVIYELQSPGEHDLTPRNTYHDDGLGALAESWDALRQVYGGAALSYALHDYDALREVADR